MPKQIPGGNPEYCVVYLCQEAIDKKLESKATYNSWMEQKEDTYIKQKKEKLREEERKKKEKEKEEYQKKKEAAKVSFDAP